MLERRGVDPLVHQSREEWDAEEEAQGSSVSWTQLGPWKPLLSGLLLAF